MSTPQEDTVSQEVAALVAAGDIHGANTATGEASEAAVASYYEVTGGHVVSQHDPGDDPHGIDVIALDVDGRMHAGEAKGIRGEWHASNTSHLADGSRQMGVPWTVEGLADEDIEVSPEAIGEEADQVARDFFQIDIPHDTFARYDVAEDGAREGTGPTEMWSASDLFGEFDTTDATAEGDGDGNSMDGESSEKGE